MAKMKGVQFKALHPIVTEEGEGFTANVYYHHRKAGTIRQAGPRQPLELDLTPEMQAKLPDIIQHWSPNMQMTSAQSIASFFLLLRSLTELERTVKKQVRQGKQGVWGVLLPNIQSGNWELKMCQSEADFVIS